MAEKRARRLMILVAAAMSCGSTGILYVWSIFNKPLMAQHGWEQTEVALAYSLYLIVVCISGFFCGWVTRRVHPRTLTLIAGTLFGAGWLLTSLATSIPALYIFFSLIAGCGNGFLYNSSITVATKWYPDKRGFANGLCVGAAGIAPLVFAPLGNMIIESFDVVSAFRVIGVTILVIYWIFGWFLKMPPADWKPEGWQPSAGKNEANAITEMSTTEVLRTPMFWILWLMLCCACTSGSMMTGQASNIGQELAGLSASEAALMVGLNAVGAFCGRFGFASLSDKIGRFNTLMVVLAINAVVMLFFFNIAHTFMAFMAVIMLVGACFGGAMATMPGVCGDIFGQKNFGQNYAFLYSGFTASGFIGPMLAAWCYQAAGSYSLAFLVAGAMSACGILIVFVARAVTKNFAKKYGSEATQQSASLKI